MEDAEVAAAANVTPAWLSAVKNDRIKSPPLDKLAAIAKVCGVPLSYLTEPMGVVPLEELGAEGGDWIIRMRGDPTLTEDAKHALEMLAEQLRLKGK